MTANQPSHDVDVLYLLVYLNCKSRISLLQIGAVA